MDVSGFKIPRHWWGKIIGGVLGLMKGSLSGAIVGVVLGHIVDRMIFGMSGGQRTRQLFFRSLFACLGHVNKADGRVTQAEITSAENLMRRLGLNEEERGNAIRAFNEGKAADYDMEGFLQEFVRHTMTRADLRQMFMEILLEGAAIDGSISSKEQAVLVRAATALRIPPAHFAAMFNAFVGAAGAGYGQGQGNAGGGRRTAAYNTLDQAYAALGVSNKVSDADIKKAYRKLVGQYHPDRLVSQGLPEEMMEKAKSRVRDINLAYDQIKQSRGFK